MDAISATGVCKRYGGRVVLDGFSLSVGEGGFHALMGPSGSGKSTFLHIAAGLVCADAGRVEVGGRDVTAMSDSAAARLRRRHAGVVFQAFNLLPGKTVFENVCLPARLDGRRPDRTRFQELAEALGIAALTGEKASTLSGGEMQRVAIARALYPRPDAILADEPTGNLDPDAALQVTDILRSMAAKGHTVIMITHDMSIAELTSRVIRITNGKIDGKE